MVNTTGYTTYEANACLVVEADTVQRFLQREGVLAFFLLEETVLRKGMSGLEDLQRVRLILGQRQLEVTVRAGRQRSAAATNRIAVQAEHRAGYRYRGVLVERTTRQTCCLCVHEVDVGCRRIVHRQLNRCRSSRGVVVRELTVFRGRDDGKLEARHDRMARRVEIGAFVHLQYEFRAYIRLGDDLVLVVAIQLVVGIDGYRKDRILMEIVFLGGLNLQNRT